MNDEQKLRLRVASEQMAAMIASHTYDHWGMGAIMREAVNRADDLIAEIERTAKAAPTPEGE